jgi:hypothetical protein
MNGVANVLTPSSFLRVNSMVVTAAGSGGSNAGVITAIADVALTQQSHMNADEGISQDGWYTVPLGKTLFVNQVEFNLAKNAGGAQPVVDFRAIAAQGGRLSGAAFIQLFDKKLDAAVSNEYDLKIWMNPASAAIARTDIIMQATTDQNATEMRIRLYGILIDD